MRKIFLTTISLIVFFYALILSPAVAHGGIDDGHPDGEATPTAKVEYELAYPGVLPDNPLHFIKAARDRFISFLINDPIKRAEFNLLTSDKRIYAAKILSDRGKFELSISVLSKSNNYLDAAIGSLRQAKKEGHNIDSVLSNLKNAVKKHQEVTKMLILRADKKFSPQLQKEASRLKEFEKSVNKIVLK